VPTIDLKWTRLVGGSVLAAGNVHFVDIDIVDGCASDGRVETGEELPEALILAAAEHGNGLATLCSDRHGAHWFHGRSSVAPLYPSSSKTHSLGTSRSCFSANSIKLRLQSGMSWLLHKVSVRSSPKFAAQGTTEDRPSIS
jgi:hypothetical protein